MNTTKDQAEDRSAAVVGVGFLGRGIVACLLARGFRVVGVAKTMDELAASRTHIESALWELHNHLDFESPEKSGWQQRYVEATTFDSCRECDYAIESVLEDLDLKREVFYELEREVGENVLIASNTSSIPITELQAGRINPERFVGMHWAEPAHATKFLELIPGEQTSEEAMDQAYQLGLLCGKEPSLLKKDCAAFIANRLAYAMYREAVHLLETGVADADTIDRSFRNACGLWASLLGPLQWIDLTGGPTAYAQAMKAVLPVLDNDPQLPALLERMSREGLHGIKTGKGFYEYSQEDIEFVEDAYRKHVWNVLKLQNEYAAPSEK